ncbi:hypothetical protein LK994_11610 [Ferruginibacter lapsinanis]|uniref:hypothetical protein n=1 Tax=Ferruginibacter lapsinanis TaxID=563172 RepID=UPI001E4BEE57|nr:hypothetical protein [Ferruginibacter lapsinanis]UEG49278.1 hypothetical protein LK994_11610 [Ferruginibacter lapsinanis]
MKKVVTSVWLLIAVMLTSEIQAQNIAINEDGATPDASSILDMKSTNKGVLTPRMTTTQQNAIASPAKGLLIYNTNYNLFMVNTGTPSSPTWTPVGGAVNGISGDQTFATGTSGSDFNISTAGTVNTFNIPDAGTTARGLVTTGSQTLGGKKTFADTLTASSAVVLSTLSSGTSNDSLLTIDATGAIKKRSATDFLTYAPPSLSFSQDNFEDFVFDAYAGSGSNDNQFSFTKATQNSGINDVDGSVDVTANDYAGMDTMSTGTNSAGRAGLGAFNFINRLKLGGKQVIYEARVKITGLGDATNNFNAYFGLMDLVMASGSITAGDPSNGVYYKYNYALNSGKWTAICTKTGTSSSLNTGITIVANTWYKIKAVVNAAGTQVDFYIDGTLIGSVSANIPTAAMKFVFKIEKTAGTTAKAIYVDYLGWKMIR